MSNPLADSEELSIYLEQKILNYIEIKKLVYKLFQDSTGLDSDNNTREFHNWLFKNQELSRVPADNKNSYFSFIHPLFFRKEETKHYPMFFDLPNKIATLAQPHCEYCLRGISEKPVITYAIDIAPIAQSTNGNKLKHKKIHAFKKAIKEHFSKRESEFKDGCKLCVTVLFIFGKNESDKDCDNMAKALNDGLNDSLIKDDVHIDHLNIMKIKTTFQNSFIMLRILESNLNKHHDVLIEKSHYEPNIKTGGRINLSDYMEQYDTPTDN